MLHVRLRPGMNASVVLNIRHSYDMGKHPVRPHMRGGQPVSGHQRSAAAGAGQSADIEPQARDAARQAAASAGQAADAGDGVDQKKAAADIAADVNLLAHQVLAGDDVPWPVTTENAEDLTESLKRARIRTIAGRYDQFQIDEFLNAHKKCKELIAVIECAVMVDLGGPEGPEIQHLSDFVEEHWEGAWHRAATELRDLYADVMFDTHKGIAAELAEIGNFEQADSGSFRLRDRDAARAYIEGIADR